MGKTIRDKTTGQYAGSIGNGKTKVPTPKPFIVMPKGEFDSSPEAVQKFKETWDLNNTTVTDEEIREMLHSGKEIYYQDNEGTGYRARIEHGFRSPDTPQLIEEYTGINDWPKNVDPLS